MWEVGNASRSVAMCGEEVLSKETSQRRSPKSNRRFNDSCVSVQDGMETLDDYPAVMVSESRGCEEMKHKRTR